VLCCVVLCCVVLCCVVLCCVVLCSAKVRVELDIDSLKFVSACQMACTRMAMGTHKHTHIHTHVGAAPLGLWNLPRAEGARMCVTNREMTREVVPNFPRQLQPRETVWIP